MFNLRFVHKLPPKAAFHTLVAFICIQVLILAYFHNYLPIFEVSSDLGLYLRPSQFHVKASRLLARLSPNRARFWSMEGALGHLDAEVPIHRVTAQEGASGPDQLFYDPRFTVSVYMHELSRAGNAADLPTLPFHWADWVDVTFSKTQIGLEQSQQLTCEMLQSRIRGQTDVAAFCKDRDALSEEEVESLGFRSRAQLPKAVISGHCPHRHPATNAVRVFMGKSYTMSHMPKPYRVIILGDYAKGGTYEFAVAQQQGSDQQLVYSGMAERFASQVQAPDGVLRYNAKTVYDHLARSVRPRVLRPQDDVMQMHSTVRGASGSGKELVLQEPHFSYPKEMISQQIAEYEQIAHPTAAESAYLDGLKACARHDGSNEPVYFKMAILDTREPRNTRKDGGWHYDWRFFNDALFYDKEGWTKAQRAERTSIILERLLRNWNRFAEEKGIVSWIMHGPLLSWYWDGLMFPYDNDIDIQMPISELVRLAKHYNQTLVVENPGEGFGRYLIDVGTYIHNRERSQTGNHIDARFIDVDSGLYIDITGLAKSSTDLPRLYKARPIVNKKLGDSNAEVYNDRRKHFYTLPQLSPLRYSMLGGVPVYVPHEIERRLRWEYPRGLRAYSFRGYYFVPKLRLWLAQEKLLKIFPKDEFLTDERVLDVVALIDRIKLLTDEEALRLLDDDETLREYHITSKYTSWHEQERMLMFTAEGKDNHTALEDPQRRRMYRELVSEVKFSQPMRKALFEYETYDRVEQRRA